MIQDYLKTIPFFSNLNRSQLTLIRSSCKEIAMPKDSVILYQNEHGQDLYIILSGKVKVSLMNENGHEVVLDTLTKGDFFGEMSILDKRPRSANVTALTDVKLATLSRDAFLEIIKKDSTSLMLNNIFTVMAARLRRANEAIETLVFLDVCGRVAKELIYLAKREGKESSDGCVKVICPTHQTIANQIGASREAVTKALKSLASNGLIVAKGREISISRRQFEII